MKQIKFSKGVERINIPFILHDLTPWQDQIKDKINEIKNSYKFSKKAKINYSIENGYAMVYLTK